MNVGTVQRICAVLFFQMTDFVHVNNIICINSNIFGEQWKHLFVSVLTVGLDNPALQK